MEYTNIFSKMICLEIGISIRDRSARIPVLKISTVATNYLYLDRHCHVDLIKKQERCLSWKYLGN